VYTYLNTGNTSIAHKLKRHRGDGRARFIEGDGKTELVSQEQQHCSSQQNLYCLEFGRGKVLPANTALSLDPESYGFLISFFWRDKPEWRIGYSDGFEQDPLHHNTFVCCYGVHFSPLSQEVYRKGFRGFQHCLL
jgi:hypothetical protein